jgi:hypothetical protein
MASEQWQKGAPEVERLFSGNVFRSTAKGGVNYFHMSHVPTACRCPPNLRAALATRQAVIVTVERRGFTSSGEMRHPVSRGWYRG